MAKTLMAAVVFWIGVAIQAQSPPAAPMVGPKVWNDIYAQLTARHEPFAPNPFLTRIVEAWKPGKALDIGMGQGRNALMLAARGWDVTGFDISDVAIGQAKAEAQKRGLKMNAIVADAETFDYGVEQYDLIAAMYVHGAIGDERQKDILRALKHSGKLVVEGFHRDAIPVGYETNELARLYGASLTLLYYEDGFGKPDGTWKDDDGKDLRFIRLVGRKE